MHVPVLEREGGIARDDKQLRKLRQRRDQVLRNAIGEIFLFGGAAHVGERQNRDRRPVERRRRCGASEVGVERLVGSGSGGWSDIKGVNAQRLGDVLELDRAEITRLQIEPSLDKPISVL